MSAPSSTARPGAVSMMPRLAKVAMSMAVAVLLCSSMVTPVPTPSEVTGLRMPAPSQRRRPAP